MAARRGAGGLPGGEIARVVLIAMAALLLLWLSIALTVSLVIGRHDARRTLGVWPLSTAAAVRHGTDLLGGKSPPANDIIVARRLAQQALGREPANAAAARNLGLAYTLDGKLTEAARAFAYAERQSRRDLPTQLWLIEARVQADDVPGALRHYDRAMRTSIDARELLLPTLIGAVQDPAIATAVGRMVAGRPNWWSSFTDALVGQSQGADAITRILPALRLDPAKPDEARQISVGLRHMVDLAAIPRAFALYRQVRGLSVSKVPPLRGGDFEVHPALAPFEWQFVDEEGRQGVREARDGAQGGYALSIYGDRAGEVARQLMVLPAGRYRLAGLVGSVASDVPQPSIAVICAANTAVLTTVPLPRGARNTFEADFQVPAGCNAQWLFIYTAGSLDRQIDPPWIDAITIRGS